MGEVLPGASFHADGIRASAMTDHSGAYDFVDNDDPKHLAFSLARYKFVAKMFAGKRSVLELGCGDGYKSRIVRQSVNQLVAFDGDEKLIEIANKNKSARFPISFECRNILEGRCGPFHDEMPFDAVYSLDVFEHIADEDGFLDVLWNWAPVCIIGLPSLESQEYASPRSKAHHINCKSGEDLRKACLEHWKHVFMFGMNDEVVHTGFLPMSHYLFALCVS